MATTQQKTTGQRKSASRKPATRPAARKTKPKPKEPVDRIHAIAMENAARAAAEEAGEPFEESSDQPTDPDSLPDEYDPLLRLSIVKRKRPCIEIEVEEGKEEQFEIKRYSEFGIGDQHQLTNDGQTFDDLWNRQADLDEKEKKRMQVILDRMYDMVFLAPPEIKGALDNEQKALVATTFTLAPLQMAARRVAKQQAVEEWEKLIREQRTQDT